MGVTSKIARASSGEKREKQTARPMVLVVGMTRADGSWSGHRRFHEDAACVARMTGK